MSANLHHPLLSVDGAAEAQFLPHPLAAHPSPPAWLPAAPWKLQVEKQLWCWPGAAGGAQGSPSLHQRCQAACRGALGRAWLGVGDGALSQDLGGPGGPLPDVGWGGGL